MTIDDRLRRAAAEVHREGELRPVPSPPRAAARSRAAGRALVAAAAVASVLGGVVAVVDDEATTVVTGPPPAAGPTTAAPDPPATVTPVPPGQLPPPVLRPTGERLPRAYRPAAPPAGLAPVLEVVREVGVAPAPGAELPVEPGPLGPVAAVQYGGVGPGLVVASVSSQDLEAVLGNVAAAGPGTELEAGGRRATLHEPELPEDRRVLAWDDGRGVAVVVVATADVGAEALAGVLGALRPGDPGPTLPPGGRPAPGGGAAVVGGSYRLDGAAIGDGTASAWGPASMGPLAEVLGAVAVREVVDGHRWTVTTALDDFGGHVLAQSYGGQPLTSTLADARSARGAPGEGVTGYGTHERFGRRVLWGDAGPGVARVRVELAGGGEVIAPTHLVLGAPAPLRSFLATAPLGAEVEALVALGAGGEELERVEDPYRPPVPPPGGG